MPNFQTPGACMYKSLYATRNIEALFAFPILNRYLCNFKIIDLTLLQRKIHEKLSGRPTNGKNREL